jgi:predicted amino acid-binding ACT domain protein
VVFVTPLRGDREIEAATEEGFNVSSHLHSVRVEGRNEPGLAAQVTRKIGQAGLNLRGLSGAVIGTQFVLHLAFDTAEAAQKAIAVLRQ